MYAGVMVERWVRVDLQKQILELLDGDTVVDAWAVSTARNGPGEREGSEQTPRGEHEVRELIGAGAPVGTVFHKREPTGEICTPGVVAGHPERDWILSRIIWLAGREE